MLVGKLMYAMLGTRPDLAYTVSALGRFSSDLSTKHAGALKRVLRYLRHTQYHGLVFQGMRSSNKEKVEISGYSDSDWAGDIDTRWSTTGYTFVLGGAAISWKSRRQATVARSSTEVEYIAVTEAASEAIWLRRLFAELVSNSRLQQINVDNSGSISLAHNPKYHDRTKHIDVRHHFIREAIENGHVVLQYVRTTDNSADILTKPLPRPRHEQHMASLGVRHAY